MKRRFCMAAVHIFLLTAFFLLIWSAVGFLNSGPAYHRVRSLDVMDVSVDGAEFVPRKLPFRLRGMGPETPVVLTASITPRADDTLYFKSIYFPARVYVDGELLYTYGLPENYPSYMKDPGKEVHLIETHGTGKPVELRIELQSPKAFSSLTVESPLLGTAKQIILNRIHGQGFSFVICAALILYGLSLVLISLFLILLDRKGLSFLWLGLLSLLAGLWTFGQNNVSEIIFKNATILFLCSFFGFYAFGIPLLRFVRQAVDFEDPRPLWTAEFVLVTLVGTALVLQLTGKVSILRFAHSFQILMPATLIFVTVQVAIQFFRRKDVTAGRFVLPLAVLSVAAVLEMVNYYVFVDYTFSTLFQLGVLIFLLSLGFIAGLAMKESVAFRNQKQQLRFERGLMEIQIKEQQKRSQWLDRHEEELAQKRHDLRHHLSVIQQMAEPDNQPLLDYLGSVMDQIPQSRKGFCENRAVSAVIDHYNSICKSKEITFTLDLVVPICSGVITDSELCVIFANLLENAVEACDRMKKGERFIKLRSSMHLDFLTITMDNSFNGQFTRENGRFRSTKRNDYGIGLTSVQSVARRAGGDCEFKTQGNVFLSSVYVKM